MLTDHIIEHFHVAYLEWVDLWSSGKLKVQDTPYNFFLFMNRYNQSAYEGGLLPMNAINIYMGITCGRYDDIDDFKKVILNPVRQDWKIYHYFPEMRHSKITKLGLLECWNKYFIGFSTGLEDYEQKKWNPTDFVEYVETWGIVPITKEDAELLFSYHSTPYIDELLKQVENINLVINWCEKLEPKYNFWD